MKTPTKIVALIASGLFLILSATSSVYAGAGASGAPWYPDSAYSGRTEFNGNLYVIFQDTGRKSIPGGIGNPAGDDYREYVVEIQFILELVPAKGKGGPLYFSGIGKTCESSYSDPSAFPVCAPGETSYNDWFYLPGDYVGRIGAALHSFLQETVYPALCSGEPSCTAYLTGALITEGTGNAEDVVDLLVEVPSPPWYWVQPITIVTP
jgi:hypothetical protein